MLGSERCEVGDGVALPGDERLQLVRQVSIGEELDCELSLGKDSAAGDEDLAA